MWTLEQAKSEFSDLLRRVDAGDPQIIDAERPCVLISMADYERLTRARDRPHLPELAGRECATDRRHRVAASDQEDVTVKT